MTVDTINDPVGVADSTSSTSSAQQTITDPVAIVDDASTPHNSLTFEVVDPVGVSDSWNPAAAYAPTLTDPPIGITDTVDQSLGAIRGYTDPVGLVDAVATAVAISVTITDSIGTTDGYSAGHGLELTDSIGISDTAAQAAGYLRAYTEAVALLDQAITAQGWATTIVDPVGLVDGVLRALGHIITDPLGIADQQAQAAAYVWALLDRVTTTDRATPDSSSPRSGYIGVVPYPNATVELWRRDRGDRSGMADPWDDVDLAGSLPGRQIGEYRVALVRPKFTPSLAGGVRSQVDVVVLFDEAVDVRRGDKVVTAAGRTLAVRDAIHRRAPYPGSTLGHRRAECVYVDGQA